MDTEAKITLGIVFGKLIIGIIFLIPPIIGAIFFTLSMFGIGEDIINLSDLGYGWNGDTFVAPIFLGLMALAGTLMTRFAIRDFIELADFFG